MLWIKGILLRQINIIIYHSRGYKWERFFAVPTSIKLPLKAVLGRTGWPTVIVLLPPGTTLLDPRLCPTTEGALEQALEGALEHGTALDPAGVGLDSAQDLLIVDWTASNGFQELFSEQIFIKQTKKQK